MHPVSGPDSTLHFSAFIRLLRLMNETIKTIAFGAIAVVALILSYLTSQKPGDPAGEDSKMGQALFETFDPMAATGIEIAEFDEDSSDAKSLEIVKDVAGWVIRRPGRPDYPANADNQVKDVSTILFDLRILDTAGDGAGQHADFGVLDPSQAVPGDRGIGKMIALKNDKGSPLARLIIGNEVENLPGTHYVRKPQENTVFIAEVQNVNDVSTKFVDWVERDFLDLDKWNIKRVTFDNFEIKEGKLVPAAVHTLDYEDSAWKLSGSALGAQEELNKDRLDEMKDAFDDLEIIDVERKPEVLASSLLKGNEFVDANNREALVQSASSLVQKGFQPVNELDATGKPKAYPNGKPMLKVVSEKGEVRVGMKDGVEYVLRFGQTYRGPEDEENATGDSRYIYAFARVNESLLDPPALEAVPTPLTVPDVNGTGPTDSNSTQGEKGDQGDKGKPPSLKPPGPPPNFTPPSAPPTTPPSLPVGQVAVANEGNASMPVDDFAVRKAQREAEISRVKSSNASKQSEFDQKVVKATERVQELNQNLAGWYYVIPNEVYEKIRLDRSDFVKPREKEEEARPEEVKASHILISYKGADRADADVTRSKEEAKAEAERIRSLIVSEGEDFAEMARKHSNGPSKTKGGDLGKFKFEVMAKPFSEAAFALEVDAVSEVVETGFGYHVIKRTE